MARDENPPFARGETFYNGTTINSSDLGGLEHEGKTWVFEDILVNAAGGAKPQRSNRPVKCMCVRNVGAAAILPGQLVNLQKSGVNYLGRVDGLSFVTGQRGYPADEFLPAAGVPVNDLFWVVVEGPAICLTDLAQVVNIAVGDLVTALTAVTSGATTAGRVVGQDLTGSTALLGAQIQNRIGHAISAVTSGNTNSPLLVEVGKW